MINFFCGAGCPVGELVRMKRIFRDGLCILFIMAAVQNSFAQADTAKCRQLQLGDLFHKKGTVPVIRVPIPKKSMFIIVPVLGSSPATGVMVGGAVQQAVFLDLPADTKISQASANVTYTSKEQFLVTLKSFYITSKNKFILQGDWRYYNYSQSTFGLGSNSPEGLDAHTDSFWQDKFSPGEQPMLYRYIKFHETVAKQVIPNIYLGLGYHLDDHFDIVDVNKTDDNITSHYAYSVGRGFDPTHYVTSGMSLNFFYDSRDNQLNPYSGKYANIQYRINPTFLGSTQASSLLWLETRFYKNLSQKNPRHMLAWWSFANFVVSGNVPYLDLPAYGYDMRNRSARSYIQGRFRGEDMLYTEVEYRFPISPCSGILGGVLFANAATLSNRSRSVGLLEYINVGYGAGLRVMVDKVSRTNLLLDFGFGKDSFGVTLGAAETF